MPKKESSGGGRGGIERAERARKADLARAQEFPSLAHNVTSSAAFSFPPSPPLQGHENASHGPLGNQRRESIPRRRGDFVGATKG